MNPTSAPNEPASPRPPPLRARLTGPHALWACLALVLGMAAFEWHARDAALAQAALDNRNLAAAVLRHATAFVRQADLVLGLLAQAHGPMVADPAMARELRALLEAHALRQPGIAHVLLLGSDGQPLPGWRMPPGTPGTAALDVRDAVEVHRAGHRGATHLGRPQRAGAHGEWVVPATRRLGDAQGRFAGVAVVLLRLEHLQSHYAQFALGPGAQVSLSSRDGLLLASQPVPQEAVGPGHSLLDTPVHRDALARQETGDFRAVSPLDGVARVYGFMQSREFPLVAMVGITEQQALAAWRALVLPHAGAVAALAAFIGWCGWRERKLLRSQRQALQELAAAQRHWRGLERALDEHAVVSLTDARGRIVHANEQFCALSQYRPEELIGQTYRIVRSQQHDDAFYRDLWHQVARGAVWKGELCNRAKDGTTCWTRSTIVPLLDAQGQPWRYLAVHTDVSAHKRTEARLHRAQTELMRLAAVDPLTGLGTRRRWDETLEAELQRAQRAGTWLAVVLLELDGFTAYNQRHGYAAGDDALQRVADLVRQAARGAGDLAIRWGGTAYALLLPGADASTALATAERLRRAVLALRILHDEHGVQGQLTASAGAHAVRPTAAHSATALAEQAEGALGDARRAGGNQARLAATEPGAGPAPLSFSNWSLRGETAAS